MPCLRPTVSRNSLPEGFGSPGSSALSDTPRRTSLSLNTSRTALARSSLLARISTDSPDQEIAAPTPRKSNRLPTSLAAWFRALSTSCLSTLLTMSKNDSATPRSSRVLGPHRSLGASRVPLGRRQRRPCVLPVRRTCLVFAILLCAVRCDGTRQVARVAKGSGL